MKKIQEKSTAKITNPPCKPGYHLLFTCFHLESPNPDADGLSTPSR